MLVGFHLPPQMPLLKSRQWMGQQEALVCCKQLQNSHGYRYGSPLF
ncbi:Hypothetical protein P9303_14211 [Prochlorococcus marinus str. MIT 9303]|nr:Hypothetical protein P9303_14211 [Prochlorococcus marinus str. MIT 9303]